MSYSVISSTYNIHSCSIVDVSQEIKDQYIEQSGNDTLEKLSFFYLVDKDIVVLNKDHSNYDFNVFLVANYLEFDETKRNVLREQSPESIKDTLTSLDTIINQRMKARA